jgi:hypothetical protein
LPSIRPGGLHHRMSPHPPSSCRKCFTLRSGTDCSLPPRRVHLAAFAGPRGILDRDASVPTADAASLVNKFPLFPGDDTPVSGHADGPFGPLASSLAKETPVHHLTESLSPCGVSFLTRSRGLPMSLHRCACNAGHSRVRFFLCTPDDVLSGGFTHLATFPFSGLAFPLGFRHETPQPVPRPGQPLASLSAEAGAARHRPVTEAAGLSSALLPPEVKQGASSLSTRRSAHQCRPMN